MDLQNKANSKDKGLAEKAVYSLANLFFTMPDSSNAVALDSDKLAIKYYQQIMDNPVNKELAVKSLIFYTLIIKNNDMDYNGDIKYNDNELANIKSKISNLKNEKFYQDYSAYCPLLKSFEK